MEKVITPKLSFVNGKAVLKFDAVSTTEEINGCEYLKALGLEDKELEMKEKELKAELEKVAKRRLKVRSEQLDLQRNGHCPIDYEQTRLVGKLTQTEITHRPSCRHKGS